MTTVSVLGAVGRTLAVALVTIAQWVSARTDQYGLLFSPSANILARRIVTEQFDCVDKQERIDPAVLKLFFEEARDGVLPPEKSDSRRRTKWTLLSPPERGVSTSPHIIQMFGSSSTRSEVVGPITAQFNFLTRRQAGGGEGLRP